MEPNHSAVTGDENKFGFSCRVVAIGASAGGLHPLQCFISELPGEFDFAVVFMQHLSTKHKSLLAELLGKARPDLDIREVSSGLDLLPSRIYLCPPGGDVRISKGKFQTAFPSGAKAYLPIDEFFSSLAAEAGEKLVGVVFSGAGTDGARGVQSIRTHGGSVFVQDPSTAEFPSMPLAAIATGQIDGVFAPEEIAREIIKMQGAGKGSISSQDLIVPYQFEAFYSLLRDKAGYNFNFYKKSVVSRRISRRMYLRGFSTVNDYLKFVTENVSEINNLALDLMIGVTSFFRDPLAWKALKNSVIRKLAAANDDVPVRIWTPASATGEEAYSIAMMLHHELELSGSRREIQVFATDVNELALEKAREGKYPVGISSEIPPEFIKKYFTYTEDGLSAVISKVIRELVVFAKHDILTDPPFSRLDLVICRNLLIYLEPEAQEKCIALFHYSLKNGGHLFLGNAESPGKNILLFKSLAHKKCRIYEKVETNLSARMPISVPFVADRLAQQSSFKKAEECRQSVTGIVQEALLEDYAPAAVAVNQNYEIIYHNGPTNRYLCQPRGIPTQNLLELLPASLRNRIRGGVYTTARDGRPVSLRMNVPCDDRKKREVILVISQLRQDLFLFVFKEKGVAPAYPEKMLLEETAVEDTAVRQLETELSLTRQELQSNIEQLKSLNEEMQSSNEELQAANEELETSREELQSLNEELITVNAQLQSKIEEQETTNNDLNNFLASANIPTIFLDHQFRVKRFTPAMSKLIKLIPSDVGRPIIDMSQEGLGPELLSDARTVLNNLVPVKKELLINGAWYVRGVLPYRTADSRIEGVIITYGDVTDIKAAEERTRHLASFPELNPNPIVEINSSGKVIFLNPAAEKALENLALDKGDAGRFLPSDMEDILNSWDGDNGFSFYREVMILGRVYAETVHLVPLFKVVRIYALDITERKRAERALGRSEEQFRQLVESIKDYATFLLDPEGLVLTWNEGSERLKGYKAEEIVGRHFSVFYTKEDIAAGKPQSELDEARARGRYEGEGLRVRKDGSEFWANVLITVVHDDAGKLLGFTKITRDITERKRAEKEIAEAAYALERERDVLQAVMNGAKNSHLVYLNRDFNFVCVNETYAQSCGYSPEDMIGKNHFALYPHEENEAIFAQVRDTGEPVSFHDKPFEFPDQPERGITYWDWTLFPVKDQSGGVDGLIFSLFETTERKKAEEELRSFNEELTRFNDAAMGRELRMIDLKNEINILCEQSGLGPRYLLDFDKEEE